MENYQHPFTKDTATFSFSRKTITQSQYPEPSKEQDALDYTKKPDSAIFSTLFKTPCKLVQDNGESLQKTDKIEARNDMITYDEATPEQTELKRKNHRQHMIEQAETEDRRYYKLKGSGETRINSLSDLLNSNSKEQGSQGTYLALKENDLNSRLSHSQCSKKGLKSKRKEIELMYMNVYVPNKKFKPDTKYTPKKVELYDRLKKDSVEFRVFKESDLCHSRFIQGLLKDADADDDCQTDTEQLELARKHVNKQLKQAVQAQNIMVIEDPFLSSTSMRNLGRQSSQDLFSFGSYEVHSQSQNSMFEFANVSKSMGSDAATKVAKKISYSQEICSMITQKNPPSL